jgi:hypothetical protein
VKKNLFTPESAEGAEKKQMKTLQPLVCRGLCMVSAVKQLTIENAESAEKKTDNASVLSVISVVKD